MTTARASATTKQFDVGETLFHVTRDPVGLLARGFDPHYSFRAFRGSFFFTDVPTEPINPDLVGNVCVRVSRPLNLLEYHVAVQVFPFEDDTTWPDQKVACAEGFDGTYEIGKEDACTELPDGSYASEIVVFRQSLNKLGRISLITQ